MTISNPTQLVDAFKKSGEFDRLRRELLAEFQQGVRAPITFTTHSLNTAPYRKERVRS
jgi:hypothetical protein